MAKQPFDKLVNYLAKRKAANKGYDTNSANIQYWLHDAGIEIGMIDKLYDAVNPDGAQPYEVTRIQFGFAACQSRKAMLLARVNNDEHAYRFNKDMMELNMRHYTGETTNA